MIGEHELVATPFDAGVLPDAVVAVPELPRVGRSRKLDRAALAALVAGAVPEPR